MGPRVLPALGLMPHLQVSTDPPAAAAAAYAAGTLKHPHGVAQARAAAAAGFEAFCGPAATRWE